MFYVNIIIPNRHPFTERIEPLNMQSFLTDTEKFEEIIEKFKRFVADINHNEEVSFNDGWLDKQEGYKKKIPEGAYKSLDIPAWDKTWIGTGKIIGHVIEALKYNPPNEGNNLVDWHQVSDFEEIKKSGDAEKIKKVESLIYRLYTEKNTDDEIFDKLTNNDALGKTYDLISYLFFIKDSFYLPNRPNNFERAFELLGEPFVYRMSKHCSWVNYLNFCTRISKIRELLAPKFDEKLTLLDAHSFCWVIGHHPEILKIDLNSSQYQDLKLVSTEPPYVSSDDSLKPKGIRQFSPISKKERESQERRNNQIGDVGELYVLNTEKQFLTDNGKPSLAEMVRHASKEDGDGLGYDIRSFLPTGQVKYIEVKTTTSKKNTKFIISDNELDFSSKNPDNYYLYRVYDFDKNAKENLHYVLKGNMREKLILYPILFAALPRNK